MTTPLDIVLENLSIQNPPNVKMTARTHGVVESTLRRRWKGKTVSKKKASSTYL